MSQNGSYEDELEAIELEFLQALDAGQRPTLEDYVKRYPQFQRELSDFIVETMKHRFRLILVDEAPPSPEAEAAVERTLRESPIHNTSLTNRMKEVGASAKSLAQSANVPVDILVKLQRRILSELPDKLVGRLSKALTLPVEMTTDLLTARQPQPRFAGAYRSDGEPEAVVDVITTFEQEMTSLKQRGKLTEEQAAEWLS